MPTMTKVFASDVREGDVIMLGGHACEVDSTHCAEMDGIRMVTLFVGRRDGATATLRFVVPSEMIVAKVEG